MKSHKPFCEYLGKHRQGEETTESAIVLQTLCYASFCYAMRCSSNRSRSHDASALRPPRITGRRSKMNVMRPQEIQHERQEAPAGPKLSARRLQDLRQQMSSPRSRRELSGAVESRQEPPGAVGSRQEPARRAARSPSGAARETWVPWELSGAHPEAAGRCREPPGALKIEHYVLHS